MSIVLSSGTDGSNDIQVDTLTDLTALKSAAPTILKLADGIIAGLNQPVSGFPAASSPVTLDYQSGNNSWTLGNFTFGLSGGVTGSVGVVQPGQNLLTYTKTFPTTVGVGLSTERNSATTGTITALPNQYFVFVELDLTIAASAGAQVQMGQVGIQASASTADTFKVKFFKNVPGDTLLKDALGQAFAGFVLPLHWQTYQHLQQGDFLYHEFNATLSLGFGVTLGLNEVFLSGQYTAAIPNSPAAIPTVTMSAEAALQANASFGATFQYSGSFEAMLWKTDGTTGRLHLYKSQSTDPAFTLGATVTVIANPAVAISPVSLSVLATAALPGGTGSVVQQLLAGSAQTQVDTWVDDVQQTITNWLAPFQQGKTALELAIDDLNSSFLLVDATCDTTQVGFPSAWRLVVAGNLQGALAQANGGITLDSGSGLEDFHHQKTDITFNLFGKFAAEWTTAQITNVSVIYAGNNTFNLVENIGLANITNVNGSGREIDLFFAAQGTSSVAGGLVLNAPELHVLLKATNNPKLGKAIAQFLSLAATGSTALQLQNQLLGSVQRGSTTQTLALIFAPTAYSKLTFSARNEDGTIPNQQLDIANYNAFANACWEGEPGVIADTTDFSVINKLDLTFAVWRAWNMTANGKDPDSAVQFPDRRHPGDSGGSDALSYLDEFFQSPSTLQSIPVVLQQASGFMNFCEDLVNLSTLAAAGGPNSWSDMCKDLGLIIHADLLVDHLVPTAYALTELVRQAGAQLTFSGPTSNAVQEPSIALTLRYD